MLFLQMNFAKIVEKEACLVYVQWMKCVNEFYFFNSFNFTHEILNMYLLVIRLANILSNSMISRIYLLITMKSLLLNRSE